MAQPTDRDATFHAGEIVWQERAGVDARMAQIGPRVIREGMSDEHRELFEKLPTLLVGSVDPAGRPWASVLAGWPGYMATPDAQTLRVDALPHPADPLRAQLAVGAAVGMLGLEPQTRRRNRANGTIIDVDAAGFTMHVEQSFGNCPRYIQARRPRWVDRTTAALEPARVLGPSLGAAARGWIGRADTLFIASAAPPEARGMRSGGVDVSHRGGRPGFVTLTTGVDGGDVLTLPDYPGNNFYNTLGNIEAWPYAGLLFIDYACGDTLQLTGRATIATDAVALRAWPGAQRLVQLHVDSGMWTPAAMPFAWSEPQMAPQLAAFAVA
ncbi:MAG: pyridoxamine 5'-phosphate oxidase family protein [Proteobacteria bacterium]|nr:pyridoxamine 5'-phosphate oxidase family protein [Pseudomonadota bacterium]